MQSLIGGQQTVAPNEQVAVGGDASHGIGLAACDLPLLQFLEVIGQVHALDVLLLVGGIVEFHPVVLLSVLIDVDAVGSTHLVDAHGMDASLLAFGSCHGSIAGGEVDSTRGKADFGLSAIVGSCAGGQFAPELCIPIEVARRARCVVHFDADDVRTAVEE